MILPPKVLVPETVKAKVFTEFVIAAPDVIVNVPIVSVPEYCKSSVPPEAIDTAVESNAPAVPTTSVPPFTAVPPP